MKSRLLNPLATAAAIVLSSFLIASVPAHAQEHGRHGQHAQAADGHDSQAWAKRRIDKEAGLLEIKPSQQSAWDEYAAVKLDIAASFAKGRHAPAPEGQDAAGLLRQRAEHMAEAAKNMTRLADATEKLQAVLSAEQKTVLKRLVAEHGMHHRHHADGLHRGMAKHDGESPAPAAKPQKSK